MSFHYEIYYRSQTVYSPSKDNRIEYPESIAAPGTYIR